MRSPRQRPRVLGGRPPALRIPGTRLYAAETADTETAGGVSQDSVDSAVLFFGPLHTRGPHAPHRRRRANRGSIA